MKKAICLAMALSFSLLTHPLKAAGNGSENSDLLKKVSDQLKDGSRTKYQLQEFIAGRNPFVLVSLEKMSVRVNYDLPAEDSLLSKNFKSNLTSAEIKNFDSKGSGTKLVRFEIVKFDYHGFGDDSLVIPRLERLGFRPANLKELAAFMDEYSKNSNSNKLSIFALGSLDVRKPSYPRCPLAHFSHSETGGKSKWEWAIENGWPYFESVSNFRFLVVRE